MPCFRVMELAALGSRGEHYEVGTGDVLDEIPRVFLALGDDFYEPYLTEAEGVAVPRCLNAEDALTVIIGAKRPNVAHGPVPASAQLAMSFGIYLVGIILLISGVIYAAALLSAPTHWIVVGTLVMLGVGILTAVKATRQRDPSS